MRAFLDVLVAPLRIEPCNLECGTEITNMSLDETTFKHPKPGKEYIWQGVVRGFSGQTTHSCVSPLPSQGLLCYYLTQLLQNYRHDLTDKQSVRVTGKLTAGILPTKEDGHRLIRQEAEREEILNWMRVHPENSLLSLLSVCLSPSCLATSMHMCTHDHEETHLN